MLLIFLERKVDISFLGKELDNKRSEFDEKAKMNQEVLESEEEQLSKVKQRTDYLLSYHRGLEAQIDKLMKSFNDGNPHH